MAKDKVGAQTQDAEVNAQVDGVEYGSAATGEVAAKTKIDGAPKGVKHWKDVDDIETLRKVQQNYHRGTADYDAIADHIATKLPKEVATGEDVPAVQDGEEV